MGQHQLSDSLNRAHMPTTGKAFYIPSLAAWLFGWGTTVPADAGAGWASGALFIHTDGSGATDYLYMNIGSASSCNFDAMAVAA